MKKIILILIAFFTLILSSCNSLRIDNCKPIYAMDTIINITFYNTKDYSTHYNEIKKIYQDVGDISNDFESNYNCNGVYDLNEKRSIVADDLLIDLINESINLMNETEGYYNPFIGRLSHLWKNAIKENKILANDIIIEELEIMNNTSIIIEDNNISLIGDGNLDLGGIAKGYATELAKKYLDENNITGYLINAGSSNVLYGLKGDSNFKIGLESPYNSGFYGIIEGANQAIGTSSPKHQYTEINNIRYHHLLNPFTGFPNNYYDSVNVMCNNSIYCDVYSTAIFSMDIEDAKKFASNKNIDIILFKDKEILYKTDGWNLSE